MLKLFSFTLLSFSLLGCKQFKDSSSPSDTKSRQTISCSETTDANMRYILQIKTLTQLQAAIADGTATPLTRKLFDNGGLAPMLLLQNYDLNLCGFTAGGEYVFASKSSTSIGIDVLDSGIVHKTKFIRQGDNTPFVKLTSLVIQMNSSSYKRDLLRLGYIITGEITFGNRLYFQVTRRKIREGFKATDLKELEKIPGFIKMTVDHTAQPL